MIEIKHTPGPWKTDQFGDIETEGGIAIATTELLTVRDMANARLISAAPELLEALYDVDATATDAYDPVMLAKVQAAIAKAEGRS